MPIYFANDLTDASVSRSHRTATRLTTSDELSTTAARPPVNAGFEPDPGQDRIVTGIPGRSDGRDPLGS
jgi:hypothetical protein